MGVGTIITNISTIEKGYLVRALEYMNPVFGKKLGMGTRLAIAREGEQLAGVKVPKGMVMLGTVCSVTVNGIMLSERIPVTSRFGGLLEMRDGKPVRFVELIEYRGTTIDPLEFFINANMTRVRECAKTGSGMIGASFREVPSVALDEVRRSAGRWSGMGWAEFSPWKAEPTLAGYSRGRGPLRDDRPRGDEPHGGPA